MDKFFFYKGHKVSLDDLNEIQDFMETSDHNYTRDWLGTGVAEGLDVVPASGTLRAFINPGAAYNSEGVRIAFPSGTEIDVSQDYLGNPTGVTTINEQWRIRVTERRKAGVVIERGFEQIEVLTPKEGTQVIPINMEVDFEGSISNPSIDKYGVAVQTDGDDSNQVFAVQVDGQGTSIISKNSVEEKELVRSTKTFNDPRYKLFMSDCGEDLKVYVDDGLFSNTAINTFMVVDKSGSMRDELSDMLDDALVVVNQMREIDSVGFSTFNTKFKTELLPVADSALIARNINKFRGEAGGNTSLFDALYSALDIVAGLSDTGRNVFIVLTDGKDNRSSRSLNDVIAKSKQVKIPIYALGYDTSSSREEDLIRLANRTGGTYRDTPTDTSLIEFYTELNSQVRKSIRTGYKELLSVTKQDRGAPTAIGISLLANGSLTDFSVSEYPNRNIFLDTFTDDDGVLLNAHIPDTGSGWSGSSLISIQDEGIVTSGFLGSFLANTADIPLEQLRVLKSASSVGGSERVNPTSPSTLNESIQRRVPSSVIIEANFNREGISDISLANPDLLGESLWGLELDVASGEKYLLRYFNEDIVKKNTVDSFYTKALTGLISIDPNKYEIRSRVLALTRISNAISTQHFLSKFIFPNEEVLEAIPVDTDIGPSDIKFQLTYETSSNRLFEVFINGRRHIRYLEEEALEGVTSVGALLTKDSASLNNFCITACSPKRARFGQVEFPDIPDEIVFEDDFSSTADGQLNRKIPRVGNQWLSNTGFIKENKLFTKSDKPAVVARASTRSFPLYTTVEDKLSIQPFNESRNRAEFSDRLNPVPTSGLTIIGQPNPSSIPRNPTEVGTTVFRDVVMPSYEAVPVTGVTSLTQRRVCKDVPLNVILILREEDFIKPFAKALVDQLRPSDRMLVLPWFLEGFNASTFPNTAGVPGSLISGNVIDSIQTQGSSNVGLPENYVINHLISNKSILKEHIESMSLPEDSTYSFRVFRGNAGCSDCGGTFVQQAPYSSSSPKSTTWTEANKNAIFMDTILKVAKQVPDDSSRLNVIVTLTDDRDILPSSDVRGLLESSSDVTAVTTDFFNQAGSLPTVDSTYAPATKESIERYLVELKEAKVKKDFQLWSIGFGSVGSNLRELSRWAEETGGSALVNIEDKVTPNNTVSLVINEATEVGSYNIKLIPRFTDNNISVEAGFLRVSFQAGSTTETELLTRTLSKDSAIIDIPIVDVPLGQSIIVDGSLTLKNNTGAVSENALTLAFATFFDIVIIGNQSLAETKITRFNLENRLQAQSTKTFTIDSTVFTPSQTPTVTTKFNTDTGSVVLKEASSEAINERNAISQMYQVNTPTFNDIVTFYDQIKVVAGRSCTFEQSQGRGDNNSRLLDQDVVISQESTTTDLSRIENRNLTLSLKRILAIYAYPSRLEQTPFTNIKGETTNFDLLENALVRVVQSGANLNPSVPADPIGGGVLLGCIKIKADTSQLESKNIDLLCRDEQYNQNFILTEHTNAPILDHPNASIRDELLDRDYVILDGDNMAGNFSANNNKVTNIAYPEESSDAARADYLIKKVSEINTLLETGGDILGRDLVITLSDNGLYRNIETESFQILFGMRIVTTQASYRIDIVANSEDDAFLRIRNEVTGFVKSKSFLRDGNLQLVINIPDHKSSIIAKVVKSEEVQTFSARRKRVLAVNNIRESIRGDVSDLFLLIDRARLDSVLVTQNNFTVFKDDFTGVDGTNLIQHPPTERGIYLLDSTLQDVVFLEDNGLVSENSVDSIELLLAPAIVSQGTEALKISETLIHEKETSDIVEITPIRYDLQRREAFLYVDYRNKPYMVRSRILTLGNQAVIAFVLGLVHRIFTRQDSKKFIKFFEQLVISNTNLNPNISTEATLILNNLGLKTVSPVNSLVSGKSNEINRTTFSLKGSTKTSGSNNNVFGNVLKIPVDLTNLPELGEPWIIVKLQSSVFNII